MKITEFFLILTKLLNLILLWAKALKFEEVDMGLRFYWAMKYGPRPIPVMNSPIQKLLKVLAQLVNRYHHVKRIIAGGSTKMRRERSNHLAVNEHEEFEGHYCPKLIQIKIFFY